MAEKKKPLSKRGQRIIPEGTVQVNFNANAANVDKLRIIADNEGLPYAEVYNKAFSKLVEIYEAANGKIKPRPRAGSLDKL
jgi:hypothetical protein